MSSSAVVKFRGPRGKARGKNVDTALQIHSDLLIYIECDSPQLDQQTRDRAGLVLTEGQALPGLKFFRIIAMIPAMRGSGGAWPSVRTREPSRGDDRLSRRRVDA